MRFISHGDFLLAISAGQYLSQHIYIWSFERGAANLDGIIRLPGRLVDIAVFAAIGNVGFGYFYLTTCFLLAFLSFLWFARSFLTSSWGPAVCGALFFALNPIFLGNASKIGLILAASMLPLALACLKFGFEKRRFSFFLLLILALNISLIHPFTFTINLVVSAVYLVILTRRYSPWVRDNLLKFALLGLAALLLHAYMLLPLVSMRTLDKTALSDQLTPAPVDYTALIPIANTGDIFTGLSLSKGVLKDYEFYGQMTWPFYFLGVFLFYALLIGVYVKVEKRAKGADRRRFVLSLGIFLGLLVLATASYLYADSLLRLVVGLPGGWTFRSPLKWQLYMPLVLGMALVIALKYTRKRWPIYLTFGLALILMNGYLVSQIYQLLLKPKNFSHFSGLAGTDLKGKHLLFADSSRCTDIARNNPNVATELNQALLSRPVQVKHAPAADLHTVNLAAYDFVLGCRGALDQNLLTKLFDFKPGGEFVSGAYLIYKNARPSAYVSAAAEVYKIDSPQNLGGKYNLAKEQGRAFAFSNTNGIGLKDIFDSLSPANIKNGSLVGEIPSGERLVIAGEAAEPGAGDELVYNDPSFDYQNLVANSSFDTGLWRQQVGDCNAKGDKAQIGMALERGALKLSTKNHIACTGPNNIPVSEDDHYLLSFDYKTLGGQVAGYHAGFDDVDGSSKSERLPETGGKWRNFHTEIVAPEGAQNLQLMIYAYPSDQPGVSGIANYDNFKLIRIPDVKNRFFALGSETQSAKAPKLEYTKINPTKTKIRITGATTPFYVVSKESYHPLWQLSGAQAEHIRVNGNSNGWLVKSTSDDIDLVMEFSPQRRFVLGSLISGATALVCLGYIVYEIRRQG
jgi:hypothetical protein